jgi:hypothetical protein
MVVDGGDAFIGLPIVEDKPVGGDQSRPGAPLAVIVALSPKQMVVLLLAVMVGDVFTLMVTVSLFTHPLRFVPLTM